MTNLSPSSSCLSSTGSRIALETLAWLIEDAFEGDPSHSLLANLRDLPDEAWTALPLSH